MTNLTVNEKDSAILFQRTAEALFSGLEQLSPREHLVLGLCGGRSVVGLLGVMRDWVKSGAISAPRRALLKKLQIFMVDERLVPLSDDNSNYGMLKRLLLDELVPVHL